MLYHFIANNVLYVSCIVLMCHILAEVRITKKNYSSLVYSKDILVHFVEGLEITICKYK